MAWYVRHDGKTLGPWDEHIAAKYVQDVRPTGAMARKLETTAWLELDSIPVFAAALRGDPIPAPRREEHSLLWLLVVAAGVALVVMHSSPESSSKIEDRAVSVPYVAPPEQSVDMAWAVVETRVRSMLKSPGSARFKSDTEQLSA